LLDNGILQMKRSANILLALGIAIGAIQITSLGVMLYDVGPWILAAGLKVALYATIAAFVVLGLRMVRRA
jgi:hypothetical protein